MNTFEKLCKMADCPEDFMAHHDLRTPAGAAGWLRGQIIKNGKIPPTLPKVIAAIRSEFHATQNRKMDRSLWAS